MVSQKLAAQGVEPGRAEELANMAPDYLNQDIKDQIAGRRPPARSPGA